MTRNFIRLLFLAFCCTAAFAAEVAIASNALSSASIANLGFENGGAHWRVPRPTWRVEDGAGRKGSKGLVWENSNPDVYSFPAQCVTLEGGGIYRFGCWVKVDSLQKDGKKIRPSVSLDWSDASGKWMSAAYAHPVVGNETDTDGWVRFEGVTSPLPAEATQGNLLCFLPKGATGKVRFDDFSFKPEAVRMVDWLCSSAYRDTATGGNVSFHASLYLNLVKHPLDSIEPCFSYTAADGRAVLAAPDAMSPQSASITIPVSAMAKGRQMVAFVLRDKQSGMGLGYAECAFTRADTISSRVRFDEHKRTLVEGQPFLPLGMYASRIDADILAKYTNGVFNCVMLYGATRDQLDVAQAAGLKVIYSVKDMVWGGSHVRKGCETREKSLKAIREAVEAAKNHPALLAWYVNDESPESQIAALREVNAIIHELDPDHPTWAVTDKPWHARPFLGTYDCLGMDPYPIGNNRGGIDIAAGWALEARKGFFDTVPMWHVPQSFNWKWYRRTSQNPEHRFPTRQELDSMFWQAIAAGANGLIPYAFHSMCKFMDGAEFDKAMADVVDVMSAIKRRESVILSDPGPSAVTDSKNLFCRTWTSKTGELWLLLSNANRERISATVTLGEKFANAQSEDGVAAALTAPNTLSVKLDPLASGFVRLAPQNLAARTDAFVEKARRIYPSDPNCNLSIVKEFVPTNGTNTHLLGSVSRYIRWMEVPGISNLRDIGGWNGLATGKVYRGSCNTSKGANVFSNVLGFRTEIDLREKSEIKEGEVRSAPNYANIPLKSYTNMFNRASAASYADVLRMFKDDSNYPIYIHCAGGADRTASIVFLLDGLCGVSRTDAEIDYELTSLCGAFGVRSRADDSYKPFRPTMLEMMNRFGENWNEKVVGFVKAELGIADEEIESIRQNLNGFARHEP